MEHMIARTAMAVLILAAAPASTTDDQRAEELVAAQVRAQGYACETPVTATPDQPPSQPDEAVWILECGNATYRVWLTPGLEATIEPIS